MLALNKAQQTPSLRFLFKRGGGGEGHSHHAPKREGQRGCHIPKMHFFNFRITINLNVNHTVSGSSGQPGEPEGEEMLSSQPDFEVDIKVGSQTLSLTCQFTPGTDITEGDHVEGGFLSRIQGRTLRQVCSGSWHLMVEGYVNLYAT